MAARRRRRVALALVALGLGVLAYSAWVEPCWIEATRHSVPAPVQRPIVIAHLTDLHTRRIGRRERALLSILERERPDAIVITGDNLAPGGSWEGTRPLLERLKAPLGVWAVRGNWELWFEREDDRAFFRSCGIELLTNEARELAPGVWLAGVDDSTWGRPDPRRALAQVPSGAWCLALIHEPIEFDRVAGLVSLALAGHSHGGQIRVPGLGPPWVPRGVGSYVAGWYELAGSKLYVSRGVGTSVFPLRLGCRPEVAFITLEP